MSGNPNIDYDIWLSNDNAIINSRKGKNLTNGLSSNSYTDGYFKNSQGVYCPAALSGSFAVPYYPQYSINMNPICVRELWLELDGWSLTGTSTSDGQAHYPQWRHIVTLPFMMVGIQSGGIVFYVGNFPYTGNSAITITTANIPANTPFHIAYGYDFTQDIMKFHLNGVEIGSGTLGGKTLAQPAPADLALGGRIGGSGNYGLRGWITRFKQVNFWKTDFTDRNDPRSELNDIK